MRTSNSSRDPNLKPVKKIELSEKHVKLRVVLVIAFILCAVAAFAYAVITIMSVDKGWNKIQAASSDINCGDDFVFYYYVEKGGTSGGSEYKNVTAAYSQATVNAYRIFNADARFDGVNNLAFLNASVNETVEVDASLYSALELISEYGNRSIYLGPAYVYYYNLLYSSDDYGASQFDPYLNEDAKSFISSVVRFANDEEAVNIALYGDNRVALNVSEEYAAFAAENGITAYLDFFMLKNAFIADYLADYMENYGCKSGIITSRDGYTRAIGTGGREYTVSVYDKEGYNIYPACTLKGTGGVSLVRLHDYRLSAADYGCNYLYSDGRTATSYVDPSDGMYKSSIANLIAYSRTAGCAEVLLNALPVYICDTFESSLLAELKEKQIYSVYCKDRTVIYNDSEISVVGLLSSDEIVYEKRYEE